jgi:hypothetical protein
VQVRVDVSARAELELTIFRYILGTIQQAGRNKVLPVSDTGEKAYSFGSVGS